MEFKVYRNGEYISDIELYKAGAEWEPIADYSIRVGDILESVADGVRLEVTSNQPEGTLRAHFRTRIIE